MKSLSDTEFINSHYVLFCTKNGVIKKTLLEQYSRPRQNGDVYKRQGLKRENLCGDDLQMGHLLFLGI